MSFPYVEHIFYAAPVGFSCAEEFSVKKETQCVNVRTPLHGVSSSFTRCMLGYELWEWNSAVSEYISCWLVADWIRSDL